MHRDFDQSSLLRVCSRITDQREILPGPGVGLSEDLLAIADGPGSIGSYSGPEVGFAEIAIDLLQARFVPTNNVQYRQAR